MDSRSVKGSEAKRTRGEAPSHGRLIMRGAVLLFCAAAIPSFAQYGRLCLGDECHETRCGERIAAADTPRTFTFQRSATRYRLATITADERTIRCGGGEPLQLRVDAPKSVETAQLIVTAADQPAAWRVWRLQLLPASLNKTIEIRLDPGKYSLMIEAPHFVTVHRTRDLDRKTAAVRMSLISLPRLEGRLIDSAHVPVANAIVRAADGCEALSDRAGSFSLEIDPEKWPKVLTISAPGFADHYLIVPPARADTSFDDVFLSRASAIVVELQEHERGEVVALDLEKLRNNGHSSGPVVKTISPFAVDAARVVRFE